jgi:hypothetical protein
MGREGKQKIPIRYLLDGSSAASLSVAHTHACTAPTSAAIHRPKVPRYVMDKWMGRDRRS